MDQLIEATYRIGITASCLVAALATATAFGHRAPDSVIYTAVWTMLISLTTFAISVTRATKRAESDTPTAST